MIINKQIDQLCAALRHDILTSSTEAGSGHPSSSLSAVELMATLWFNGYFRYDFSNPHNLGNDRMIFSKGHASPLYFSLYHRAGAVSYEELLTFRKINSDLEGHPTPRFKYTEAATGSLGQGLSVGLGMALGIRLHAKGNPPVGRMPNVYVLLGDSEVAEGQVWEAMQLASYHKVNNLIAILDVNRLGQRGATMLEWDLKTYEKRASAFGWNTIVLEDGHNIEYINNAYQATFEGAKEIYQLDPAKPTMIIARTMKGKGISFIENKDDWHGKALSKDMLTQALNELGDVDMSLKGEVQRPEESAQGGAHWNKNPLTDTKPWADKMSAQQMGITDKDYSTGGALAYRPNLKEKMAQQQETAVTYSKPAATREAYGDALAALGQKYPQMVVLDAETSNSTYADRFAKKYPERYFEMFIAEQNMVSVGVGLSRLGFVPFVSSFAAFLTRAFDQIRMAQYNEANLKVVGSHAGVSIGYDGSSQMGLEDLAMMRSLLESVVLYPSDAVSAVKLTESVISQKGVCYIRTTREKTPLLYKESDTFPIGGSKVLREGDKGVIIAAGITLHEALKAAAELDTKGISMSVVDLYSVKPIDKKTIVNYAKKTGFVLVVEDHYPEGGIGDAVAKVLVEASLELGGKQVKFVHLCPRSIPHSGSPAELMDLEEIDAASIVKTIKTKI